VPQIILQWYNKHKDEWLNLQPWLYGILFPTRKYRILLQVDHVSYTVHWEIPNPEKFDQSFIQDLPALSYWVGYNEGGWLEILDWDGFIAGRQDREGDKVLLNKYIDTNEQCGGG